MLKMVIFHNQVCSQSREFYSVLCPQSLQSFHHLFQAALYIVYLFGVLNPYFPGNEPEDRTFLDLVMSDTVPLGPNCHPLRCYDFLMDTLNFFDIFDSSGDIICYSLLVSGVCVCVCVNKKRRERRDFSLLSPFLLMINKHEIK